MRAGTPAVVQVGEPAQQSGQTEVEAAQSEHREGVGGPDDERAGGDCQYRRHRVDREDQIGRLDSDQHDEQQRGDSLALDPGEEPIA